MLLKFIYLALLRLILLKDKLNSLRSLILNIWLISSVKILKPRSNYLETLKQLDQSCSWNLLKEANYLSMFQKKEDSLLKSVEVFLKCWYLLLSTYIQLEFLTGIWSLRIFCLIKTINWKFQILVYQLCLKVMIRTLFFTQNLVLKDINPHKWSKENIQDFKQIFLQQE